MARPKGATNHQSKAIKDMIIAALDAAGGKEYFIKQSKENPTAFMALVAKVIPTQVTGGDNGEPIQININYPGANRHTA